MLWDQVLPALTTGIVLLTAAVGSWWSAMLIMRSVIDDRIAVSIYEAEKRIIEAVDGKLNSHQAERQKDMKKMQDDLKKMQDDLKEIRSLLVKHIIDH